MYTYTYYIYTIYIYYIYKYIYILQLHTHNKVKKLIINKISKYEIAFIRIFILKIIIKKTLLCKRYN